MLITLRAYKGLSSENLALFHTKICFFFLPPFRPQKKNNERNSVPNLSPWRLSREHLGHSGCLNSK